MTPLRWGVLRAAAATAGIAAVVLGPTACGGDDRQDDAPGSATSAGGSPTEDTEDTDDTDDTDTPAEEVDPADGQQINTEHLSVNLPEGWRGKQTLSLVVGKAPEGLLATIYVNDVQVPGVPARPLGELARDTVRSLNELRDPEVLDPVEVDGVEVYHLAGDVSSARYIERFGPSVDEATVSISFEFISSTPQAERQEVIDSVLASVDWTI